MRTQRSFAATAAAFALLALLLPATAAAQAVPSPEEHFGFPMGAAKQLARWDGILEYFEIVADGSERIRVDTVGPSTLGNPFVVVTLSSPDNLARLDEIRTASAELAQGRIDRARAEAIAEDLPATVFINHNIHSTEIASSQTSVDLVYRLATGDDEVTRTVVDNVVTVLIPSANPDGQIMVTDWYREWVGTEWEGGRMPWLYHHYAGHDNNRDFFQANLVETRYWMEQMFHTAYPQIYLDQHQMGGSGPRMFVPPYPDPMNPDVHPLQWQALKFMGGGIVTDLQAAGKEGVISNAMYRIWGQEGALTGRYHNIVALLTETASANIASPDTVTLEQLQRSANRARDIAEYGFSMAFPDPWWGGEWTLADIVSYQNIAAMSVLEQTARFRDRYVMGRWQMAAETIQRGAEEEPFAFIIPREQSDPVTAAQLVSTLILQGVEVHEAGADFQAIPEDELRDEWEPGLEEALEADEAMDEADEADAEGEEEAVEEEDEEEDDDAPRSFSAGDWVVLAAQPARAAVLDLLQPHKRELQREYPDGPWLRSYDAAAYTMPLQMGVEAVEVEAPFEAELTPVTTVRPTPPPLPEAAGTYALPVRVNRSYEAANRLLAQGLPVSRTQDGEHFVLPAGRAGVGEALRGLRDDLGITVLADVEGAEVTRPLRRSHIGLYQGWAGAMDEGWTRYLLEDFHFDFQTLSNDDVREGGLAERFDAVIIPSEISLDRLIEGADEDDAPPEYVGGIGEEGVEALQAFVREGGTLLTLDRGDALVLERFDVPVKNALEGLSSQELFAPASLFRIQVDTHHPLAAGADAEMAAKWAGGRAYEPASWDVTESDIRVVARWAEDADRLLMSGQVVGAEHLADKAAILEVGYGQGRILMYGFRVQHRAQTAGTFRFLFNALFRDDPRVASQP